tara:strand:+ start:339 stop:578 length:240 start_codon:yes stop_codon:yes gene_type:complete
MSVDRQQHDMQEEDGQYKQNLEQAGEEAHLHHVASEFSDMILSLGPNAVLGLLKEEARAELRKSIIISYNHRLIETTGL